MFIHFLIFRRTHVFARKVERTYRTVIVCSACDFNRAYDCTLTREARGEDNAPVSL